MKNETMALQDPQFCEFGQAVIHTEAEAIYALHTRINNDFAKACQLLLDCHGRVVVMGMGKSGHIANKIAATLASTGTPSFFVHPGEAHHGDMGMVTTKDVILALSNSGETPELIYIIPFIKRLNVPLITLTGKANSTIAKAATINLDVSIKKEACPLGLAPTASTTATLVMGDALAIALLQARGFTSNDFALFHPGGTLGRRLLLRIHDLMNTHQAIPMVTEDCLLDKALVEITKKRLGMTVIVNDSKELLGVYTDGDLRRTLDQGLDVHTTKIGKVMTRNCITIPPKLLAAEALKIMEEKKITSLVVIGDNRVVLGVVHMHDLLRTGVL